MILTPIHTPTITPQSTTLLDLLDQTITELPPRSVLAITSKIVSLCEGSVVPIQGTDKAALVRSQADLIAPRSGGKWGASFAFTVKDNTLIPNAGIDESNAGDVYVVWPKDSQTTANLVREHLVARFGYAGIGVIITDSTCRPQRRGVSGIALAYSGFKPLHDYVGQPDLFNRPFKVSQADIAGGLAAAAVLVMGEGAESTPLVLMQDVSVAEFVDRGPTAAELAVTTIPLEEDLFAPFLEKVDWEQGSTPAGGGA